MTHTTQPRGNSKQSVQFWNSTAPGHFFLGQLVKVGLNYMWKMSVNQFIGSKKAELNYYHRSHIYRTDMFTVQQATTWDPYQPWMSHLAGDYQRLENQLAVFRTFTLHQLYQAAPVGWKGWRSLSLIFWEIVKDNLIIWKTGINVRSNVVM